METINNTIFESIWHIRDQNGADTRTIVTGARSLVVSHLRSESKGSRFESGY